MEQQHKVSMLIQGATNASFFFSLVLIKENASAPPTQANITGKFNILGS